MHDRTRECIRRRNIYVILSWTLCFGVATGLLIYGFSTKWAGTDSEVAHHIKAVLIIWTISLLPMLLLSLLVKDKVKPTIRMINVILAAYLVSNWFMFIIGFFMLLDTYFISGAIKKYNAAIIANKEMDKRDLVK